MSRDVLHVVPHNETWAVKREGNERPSSTHDTQRDAIENARNLAKEGDDIVIHRPDGTIRERSTYMVSTDRTNGNKTPITPSDVRSVGSRVSWSAVLAGAVVALAVTFALTLLSVAIGITTLDNVQGRTDLAPPAAILMTVALLAALFLGGYVASLTTAGENHREAVIYGVLVWGAMFGLSVLLGSAVTSSLGSVLGPVTQADANANVKVMPGVQEMRTELDLSQEQAEKYTNKYGGTTVDKASRAGAAWWAFATLILSLLAAMGGAYMGAGPEIVFRRIFVPRGTTTTVPNPA